ncbi:hypothetical protein HPB47_013466 [Ixodes persulcatus]|uniref:Uncharacterized protein n=1 Tax=Ixodes persulcatus TaxID=34615 RepID=A0AC60R1Y1_IXOPE|nr:hypothetical protein HPB47_013466 [Ixodes persulcatus]
MHALVRFPNDGDNKLHIVPVGRVKDLHPADEEDFDPKAVYSVFWDDPGSAANSGYYPAQILMMAETEEGLLEKMKVARVRKIPIPVSEFEEDEDGTMSQTTASRKGKNVCL